MSIQQITVKSSELRTGDIVLTNGMRCLIDGPIGTGPSPYHESGVFFQRARVLNISDVEDAWLVAHTTEYQSWPNRGVPTGEHRWTIQGNDNVSWLVERRIIDLGGPDGGRYWQIVSEHDADDPDARAAAVLARATGSIGATNNEACVVRA